jgi:dUTP pyrophosphatase
MNIVGGIKLSRINQVKVVRLNKDLPLPEYKTKGSSGMDLYSSIYITIPSGQIQLIKTGIAIALPELNDELFSLEAQVRPRSGMALKHGITVLNTPGTVDEDYRGEVGVILINHSGEDFVVNKGDRIAQLVFCIVAKMNLKEVDTLDETVRGSGGFGHTGTK